MSSLAGSHERKWGTSESKKYLAPKSVTLTNVVAPDFDKCGDISYQRRQTARAKDAERCCDGRLKSWLWRPRTQPRRCFVTANEAVARTLATSEWISACVFSRREQKHNYMSSVTRKPVRLCPPGRPSSAPCVDGLFWDVAAGGR